MEMRKMYASQPVIATDEPVLIEKHQSLITMMKVFGPTEEFRQAYRDFIEEIREMTGFSTVITLDYQDEKGLLFIFSFDVFPQPGVAYETGFDEQGRYLMVPATHV